MKDVCVCFNTICIAVMATIKLSITNTNNIDYALLKILIRYIDRSMVKPINKRFDTAWRKEIEKWISIDQAF